MPQETVNQLTPYQYTLGLPQAIIRGRFKAVGWLRLSFSLKVG